MTSVSKNAYIEKLDDMANKYKNTFQSKTKMKPVDVKSSTHIDFDEKNNKEYPKFKVDDYVRILKYKNIFTKGYVSNWSEEVFVITKDKNTVPGTYVISHLKSKEIFWTFYKKEFQKANKKEFRIKKVNKRKDEKVYVKWKGYDNSFNSWIDKKVIVMWNWVSYFPPYSNSKIKIEVELDFSIYATKSYIKTQ